MVVIIVAFSCTRVSTADWMSLFLPDDAVPLPDEEGVAMAEAVCRSVLRELVSTFVVVTIGIKGEVDEDDDREAVAAVVAVVDCAPVSYTTTLLASSLIPT
eukprot:CAMPEP_0118641818 /NCGR_PEP_ID=MMETSP0785-20121206/5505_1 /TAXON_ID=91992 /ORGANISM="Bolidomonas pacifica, Strain CCMP 1866" /LENGTH=100 /DNA_ID=CAMNT_0006533329 /DNA_START=225 /DNA_END=523 /DNA_ORIENTATION=-